MKADPLAGLHDIHLPEPVSWWPPAPGWWLLPLLLLSLLLFLYLQRKRRQSQAAARLKPVPAAVVAEAECELDSLAAQYAAAELDDATLAVQLSALLRRTVMALHGSSAMAGLSGDAWLQWLDTQWGEQVSGQGRFADGHGAALLAAAYQAHGVIDADALVALLRDWLQAQRCVTLG